MIRSDRPALADIIAMVRNTVRCQVHNSEAGRRLLALDREAVASLEDQLTNNLAQVVDGTLTEVTGVES